MYIPYEKIGNFICNFSPDIYQKQIKDFFYNKKVNQNCEYIEKNSKKVLKRLRDKIKKEKLKVCFLCDDKAKWKCQSLFDLMLADPHFEPVILTTKNTARPPLKSCMTKETVKEVYNFFKAKNMPVQYAYDVEKDKHIPLQNFKPDIIFYEQPWYIETKQGPVVCSKFALTCYVPYFISASFSHMEYNLRFHQYVNYHYILNKIFADFYSSKMNNKGKNLVVSGHPVLDFYYENCNEIKEKKYIIYAPHHSVGKSQINFATFEWNGKFMLEYAKNHPEFKWIFKPHPNLYNNLISEKIMTKDETEQYYNEWDNIGLKYENSDYFDLFISSIAMITDSGSFLTEYLQTQNPVIRMVNPACVQQNTFLDKILTGYYNVKDINELSDALEKILIKQEDPKKDIRLNIIKELELNKVFAAQNILTHLKNELGIKNI